MCKKKIAILLSSILSFAVLSGAIYVFIMNDTNTDSDIASVLDTSLEVYNDISTVKFEKGFRGSNYNAYKNTSSGVCHIRANINMSDSRLSNYIHYVVNTKDWVLSEDEYFYYKDDVQANNKTSPLIKEVKVIDSGVDISTINDINISVHAESILLD